MIALRIAGIRADPLIARGFPFLLFIAFLMLGAHLWTSAGEGGAASTDGAGFVVARYAIVALALLWFWPSYSELRKPAAVHPAYWLLAVLAGVVVFLLWIFFSQDWAVFSRSPEFKPLLPDGSIDWPIAILRLAGLALVVPIMEELFWRSFIMRWIERQDFLAVSPGAVGIRAFAITTIMFALEHNQWLAGAIAGMTYNWLYMRSGNLWVPIVAHAVTNGTLGIWVLYTQDWRFW